MSAVPDDAAAPAAAPLGKALEDRHVEMIAIGGIIGAGLFVGSSASIAAVGPAVMVSYGLAGAIVLMVMRMLSEMAVALPGVQSFADFARLGLGHWAGFVSGWLYWYFWVVVVAIEAIAGARIIHEWLPTLPVGVIGVGLMAVLTGVNLLSTRSYGEFEFWLSSIKVAAILVFILVAGAFVAGLTAPDGPTLANLTAHGGFIPNGATAVIGGVTSVIFALTGAEIATVAAAESAGGARTVARMTYTVALRILIFYVLSIGLIVAAIPWTQITPGVSPFATALGVMGVPGGELVMNAIVLVAVLSCLNSGLYVTSRVLFGLAAQGDAPPWLVAVDRRRVPARAILIGSVFAYAALGASVISPERVFAFLVNASGALMIVIYGMIAVAQIRIRNRLERSEPDRLVLRMWLHPWGALATLAAMAGVLLAMALTPELASQVWASLLIVAVAGVACLVAARRRRAGS
ncbi:MAG: amino acid permease [Phenylobacterium sp.]|uniref:amino acid permease n=1 Tax=Phenylobacterium sp. TaxID=1871053 RepID=UPI001A58D304|nr:amino acid permease [Phenylobacterium sp.]MBL8774026.1 amino acid permease [Phenylobacterium sp.]